MDWPQILCDALPPERDDEPANLRGDIADELADHLASAMSQELSRTGDEEAARRKVLERFGDPGQVARRLWWDSMGTKIMGQRILVGAVCVMALASLVACALVWQSLQENSRINQAILARLEAPSTSSVYDAPASLEIECFKETNPNEAVVGYHASLHGPVINPGENVSLYQTTNESGEARFGPLRPGSYELQLYLEKEEQHSAWAINFKRSFLLLPGQERRERVLFPPPPLTGELSISIEWPEPQVKKASAFVLHVSPFSWHERNIEWTTFNNLTPMVVDKSGRVLRGFPRTFTNDDSLGDEHRYQTEDIRATSNTEYLAGSYTLERVTVISTEADSDDPKKLVAKTVAEIRTFPKESQKFRVVEGNANSWTIKLPSYSAESEEWRSILPAPQ